MRLRPGALVSGQGERTLWEVDAQRGVVADGARPPLGRREEARTSRVRRRGQGRYRALRHVAAPSTVATALLGGGRGPRPESDSARQLEEDERRGGERAARRALVGTSDGVPRTPELSAHPGTPQSPARGLGAPLTRLDDLLLKVNQQLKLGAGAATAGASRAGAQRRVGVAQGSNGCSPGRSREWPLMQGRTYAALP
ncbi:hypothetical protein T492DRAFT_1140939 [Pavlovales sp. CCMP2436]|nr:hypothetical protein T492DRAFT_1140939 [Pavlovales sp. CCMP2436]